MLGENFIHGLALEEKIAVEGSSFHAYYRQVKELGGPEEIEPICVV